jgi:hypothetical protein
MWFFKSRHKTNPHNDDDINILSKNASQALLRSTKARIVPCNLYGLIKIAVVTLDF